MNRAVYKATRRSIRDNGLRYTMHYAKHQGDTDTLLTCNDIDNVQREVDLLVMRQGLQRCETKAIAFKLTSKLLEN